MKIEDILTNNRIEKPSVDIMAQSKKVWDSIIKPLDSFGRFEEEICRVAAIQKTVTPDISKGIVLVYAADNGITHEGISQSEMSVTAVCTDGIADGNHSVSVMAKAQNMDFRVIDVGVHDKLHSMCVIDKKIRAASRDFAIEPAMTREEAMEALQVGIDQTHYCKEQGYGLMVVGEMGIGNTTTSTAVACALLGLTPAKVTGRGAGLDSTGLKKKISVIEEALERYDIGNMTDPYSTEELLKVLECVGGYDIAAMAGTYIGTAVCGIPVVLDGVISSVAALLADRLVSGVRDYIIPSHMSREPVMEAVLNVLELKPVINADMALGEGTGGVMMAGMLKTAMEVYKHSARFDDKAMVAYEHLE